MSKKNTFAHDVSRSNGSMALAYRMAGYIKSADYIHAYVMQSFHRSPSVAKIEAMQAEHAKREADFAREPATYAFKDDGEPFRVRGLVK